jgi:hypothetical protein
VLLVWPMVALVLVLFGATFATSGRPAQRPRNTGDRLMVVIAPDDGGATVVRAIDAARRSGADVTVVADSDAMAAAYDRMGRLEPEAPPAMNQAG